MFMVAAALLLILTVPLLGGDLRRLADIHLRGLRVLYGALGVQLLVTLTHGLAPHAVYSALHILSYLGVAGFVWLNRRLAGVLVIAGGAALNAITIALNGGTLPASAGALREVGLPTDGGHFANSSPLAHPRLAFLGDRWATPSWIPWKNVFSIGDLVILAGAALLLHVACRSWPVRATSQRFARTSLRPETPQASDRIEVAPAFAQP